MVRGLAAEDFSLTDNDRAQRFRIDESGQAFSFVIAIQTNTAVREWLPEVNASASAIEALPILGFADDVTVVQQEMTGNTPALDKSLRALRPSGNKSRCLDAILKAAGILAQSPTGAQRVLLLIAQPGDAGSTTTLREAMAEIERQNITVFSLAMPALVKTSSAVSASAASRPPQDATQAS